ncbi:MAG: right-handed parallel beta-helix repeat-containing protein [Promethearchaeota archaeon]
MKIEFLLYGETNMKSNAKLKIIILITLGILFALALMITANLSFNTANDDVINLDKENPKTSEISGKIHIDNNWTDAWSAGICTGNGTYSDPYVIEDLEIDGEGSGNSILIENSNVYFKIVNCTLYNTEWGSEAGIGLLNVNNSQLIGNNCSYSQLGIVFGDGWGGGSCYNNTLSGNIVNNNRGGMLLSASFNNTVSGNTANNNTWCGIYILACNYTVISGNTMNDNNMHGLHLAGINSIISGNIMNDNNMHGMWIAYSYNNTFLRNTVNNNNWSGICLFDSNNNIISGNTAFYNTECGIFLFQSNHNTISENTANNNEYGIFLYNSGYNIVSGNYLIGNDECIVELNCEENIIQDNDCTLTPSLNYLPSILIISIAIVGVSVFMIYKNGKMFKKPQEDLDFL